MSPENNVHDIRGGKRLSPEDPRRKFSQLPPDGGGTEPPHGGGSLLERVKELEVQQEHLASRADITDLKSWLTDKLLGNQQWLTERIEKGQWRAVTVIASLIAAGIAAFATALSFMWRAISDLAASL